MMMVQLHVESAEEASRLALLVEQFQKEREARIRASIAQYEREAREQRDSAPVAEPTDEQLFGAEVEVEYVEQPQSRTATIEEANTALARYASAKGVAQAKELLVQAGANRITELSDAQRTTFVALVAEKLA